MTLTEQEIKQIERDAFDLCPDKDDFFDRAMRAGYTLACIKYVPQLRAERERAGKLLEALVKCLEATKELNGEYQDGWDKEIEQAETAIHNYKNNQ